MMEKDVKIIIRLIKKHANELKGGLFDKRKKLKNKEVEITYLGGGDSFTDPMHFGDYLIKKKKGGYYLLTIGLEEIAYVYNIKSKEVVGDPIFYSRAAE